MGAHEQSAVHFNVPSNKVYSFKDVHICLFTLGIEMAFHFLVEFATWQDLFSFCRSNKLHLWFGVPHWGNVFTLKVSQSEGSAEHLAIAGLFFLSCIKQIEIFLSTIELKVNTKWLNVSLSLSHKHFQTVTFREVFIFLLNNSPYLDSR